MRAAAIMTHQRTARRAISVRALLVGTRASGEVDSTVGESTIHRLACYRSLTTSTLLPDSPLHPASTTAARTYSTPSSCSAWDSMDESTRSIALHLTHQSASEKNESLLRHRSYLSRAITLVESSAPAKQTQACLLLTYLLQPSDSSNVGDNDNDSSSSKQKPIVRKKAFRLGIAGAPGAGKSTFIEALGKHVLRLNKENSHDNDDNDDDDIWKPNTLAVLCIDPSSPKVGGSILGDKTRMPGLSVLPTVYVRPSPTSGAVGGLSHYSTDVVTVVGQAGYEWVVLETVGLGQSETDIAQSVDVMLLLIPPAGGDDLQGVKKGIVEVADLLVVTKADGTLLAAAERTAQDYRSAMQFFRVSDHGERPEVLLASSVSGEGLEQVWNKICRLKRRLEDSGQGREKQLQQSRYWMWKNLQHLVQQQTKTDPALQKKAVALQEELSRGTVTPRVAAAELLHSLTHKNDDNE